MDICPFRRGKFAPPLVAVRVEYSQPRTRVTRERRQKLSHLRLSICSIPSPTDARFRGTELTELGNQHKIRENPRRGGQRHCTIHRGVGRARAGKWATRLALENWDERRERENCVFLRARRRGCAKGDVSERSRSKSRPLLYFALRVRARKRGGLFRLRRDENPPACEFHAPW